MNDHADLDLIAAFREGLLDPATSERVGRHIDGCATCASRKAALDEVTSLLAQAPTPALPQQVAHRLDAALAAEIATARQTARTTDTRARSRHSGAARGRARRGLGAPMLRPLAAAAAVVSLIVGAGFALHSLGSNSPGSRSTASRPVKSPAFAGGASSAQGQVGGPRAAGVDRAVLYLSTGTSYSPTSLRAEAAKVLQRYASRIPSPTKAGVGTNQQFGASSTSDCLRRVSGGRQPLVVDRATYQGRSVNVIIAPATGTAAGHVWVVGLGCSATASDIIAQSSL